MPAYFIFLIILSILEPIMGIAFVVLSIIAALVNYYYKEDTTSFEYKLKQADKPKPYVNPYAVDYIPELEPDYEPNLDELPDNPLEYTNSELLYTSKADKLIYMQSDKWANLKRKRLSIANYTCESTNCVNTTNLELHHLEYSKLTAEPIEHLKILCRLCHQHQHNIYGYDRITRYYPVVSRPNIS